MIRPEPHFDTTLGALHLPPDVPRPDNNDLEQAGGIARGVLGAGLPILTVAGGIVLGCVLAFLAGKAA